MDIQYRIIKKDLINRQIVVRFFTNLVTEIYLAAELGTDGLPINLVDGKPSRCRTDYMITFPLRVLTQTEETTLIMSSCPWKWFEDEERIIQSRTSEDAEISAISTAISSMSDDVGVLTFQGTTATTPETIKADKLKRIDADFGMLMFLLYGAMESLYKTAYQDAQQFKSTGYVGVVPAYIEGYMKSDPSILNATVATDIIIKKHQESADIAIDINTNRLMAKKGIRENKEKSLIAWNKFVAKTKTKIG